MSNKRCQQCKLVRPNTQYEGDSLVCNTCRPSNINKLTYAQKLARSMQDRAQAIKNCQGCAKRRQIIMNTYQTMKTATLDSVKPTHKDRNSATGSKAFKVPQNKPTLNIKK